MKRAGLNESKAEVVGTNADLTITFDNFVKYFENAAKNADKRPTVDSSDRQQVQQLADTMAEDFEKWVAMVAIDWLEDAIAAGTYDDFIFVEQDSVGSMKRLKGW